MYIGGLVPDHKAIVGSNALDRLATRLRTNLWTHESDGLENPAAHTIRRQILDYLPRKKFRDEGHHIIFHLKWSHIANLPWTDRRSKLNGLIITSCSDKAQLVTGEQYLCQKWPWSGHKVFDLVRHATYTVWRNPHANSYSHSGIPTGQYIRGSMPMCWGKHSVADLQLVSLWNGTHLSARHALGDLVITATGPAYTLAECGEQLAWVAASMWGPRTGLPLVSYTPCLRRRTLEDQLDSSGIGEATFDILVEETPILLAQRVWADVVRRGPLGPVVVVNGFPVFRQPDNHSGLEASPKLYGPRDINRLVPRFRMFA